MLKNDSRQQRHLTALYRSDNHRDDTTLTCILIQDDQLNTISEFSCRTDQHILEGHFSRDPSCIISTPDTQWTVPLAESGGYLICSPQHIMIHPSEYDDYGTVSYHLSDSHFLELPYSKQQHITPITVYRDNINVVMEGMNRVVLNQVIATQASLPTAMFNVRKSVDNIQQTLSQMSKISREFHLLPSTKKKLAKACEENLKILLDNCCQLEEALSEYGNILPVFFKISNYSSRWYMTINQSACASLASQALRYTDAEIGSDPVEPPGNITAALNNSMLSSGVYDHAYRANGFGEGLGNTGFILEMCGKIFHIAGVVFQYLKNRKLKKELRELLANTESAIIETKQTLAEVHKDIDTTCTYLNDTRCLIRTIQDLPDETVISNEEIENCINQYTLRNTAYLVGGHQLSTLISEDLTLDMAASAALRTVNLFCPQPIPKKEETFFKQTLIVGYCIENQDYSRLLHWLEESQMAAQDIRQVVIYCALVNSSSPKEAYQKISNILSVTPNDVEQAADKINESLLFSGACND
jgi:hypothetical protein